MRSNIEVQPIPALKDNYIWCIINKTDKNAVIVDPGDPIPVRNFIEKNQLALTAILLTHHHWDHTNGIHELKKLYPVKIFAPLKENIKGIDQALKNADEVNIDPNFPISLQVIEIPGHTLGHVAYYAPGMVFSGDTLFAVGCGRLFEGTAEQMLSSLNKLKSLPDDTKVFCGHEYTLNNLKFAQVVEPHNVDVAERLQSVTAIREQNLPTLPSSIKEEKATNPFFRCHEPGVVETVEAFVGRKLDNELEVFTELRRWKDGF